MFTPAPFQVTDKAEIAAFLSQYSFATIVTQGGEVPHATHAPVQFEPHQGEHGLLSFHVARDNPQWRHFAPGKEVLAIFTGPHAYVSPAWYLSPSAVPTWNYTAVHVYGVPRILTDQAELLKILRDLIETYESARPNRWSPDSSDGSIDRLLNGIVGVEITITRIEAQFKLSQNRPDDQPGVIQALSQSADQRDREVAELMRRTLKP